MKLAFKVALLGALAFGSQARAEFFSCNFTQPFVRVLLSSKGTQATIETFGIGTEAARILSVNEKGGKISIRLASSTLPKIEIQRNVPGSDGASDFIYPYLAKLSQGPNVKSPDAVLYGGCEGEKTVPERKLTVSRLADLRGTSGAALVNYWPGEAGLVTGYWTKAKTIFPARSTYNSIRTGDYSLKTCTVKAGKYFVPIKAKKGEVYASLALARSYKAKEADKSSGIKVGQKLTYLAYSGQGICAVERNGKVLYTSCPASEELDDSKDVVENYEEPLPLGNYVFTKCQEGHSTWISEELFTENENFKRVVLGL